MPDEHAIRLRGAWTIETADGVAGRRALPAPWPPGPRAPFRLIRRFGRPPLDPGREALALRLEAVVGLRRVRLDGRVLAEPPTGTADLLLPLGAALPARGELILEVDPAPWDRVEPGGPWGLVALVVTPC